MVTPHTLVSTLRMGKCQLRSLPLWGNVYSTYAYCLFALTHVTSYPPKLARSLFASCDKDWKLRIYKTAGNKLVLEKLIQGMPGVWTITDHNLSLDNDWLIYSSITPNVHLTRTAADAPDTHHRLDFSTDDDDNAV